MLLQKGQRLLMIGDSVTDAGRARPIGEKAGLGNGYPALVKALLDSAYPELAIRVTNTGVSGNTVRDLKKRWREDVIDLRPDWVSIMIGINDVWRQFDSPEITESHVYLAEYADTLDALVLSTEPLVSGIVLMTPYFMEPLKDDAMRAAMDKYGAAVKRIADTYGTLFVDTQAIFDGLLGHMHSANIAWDRVHPNLAGHMALARGLLGALEFDR